MIGNAGLMGLPKTAFLSSRRVAPAAVMRCYDWATGMRGGGRGATGGARTLYYWDAPDRIYMIFCYLKNERENITPEQLKTLRKLVEENLK